MVFNKVMLVTGGTRGIGRAIVESAVSEGYRVAFCYKTNMETATKICEKLNKEELRVIGIKSDITKPSNIKKLVNQTISVFGKIDVLVNNCGVALNKLLIDCDENDWKNILSNNLTSAVLLSKEVVSNMLNIGGSIVNISSIWGQTGASCESLYSATKAGLIGFTKALAKEYCYNNIRVNCVSPGIIETDMNKRLTAEEKELLVKDIPLGRVGQPKEVAELVLFLAGESSQYITGQDIGINGGLLI